VGVVCHLTCSPLHWSSSSLSTICTWRGVWDVGNFTCRPQAAALVGPRGIAGAEWEAGAEVWPAARNRSLLPGLPVDYAEGTAGYLSGSLYYCGGRDLKDPSYQPRPTCHSLRPPARRWEAATPLLQVRPWHPPLPSVLGSVWGLQCSHIQGPGALDSRRTGQGSLCPVQHTDREARPANPARPQHDAGIKLPLHCV
jgi:hypothetical protein